MLFDRREFLKHAAAGAVVLRIGAECSKQLFGGTYTVDGWNLQYLQVVEKTDDMYRVEQCATVRLWRDTGHEPVPQFPGSTDKPFALYADFRLDEAGMDEYDFDGATRALSSGDLHAEAFGKLAAAIADNLTGKGRRGFLEHGGGASAFGQRLCQEVLSRAG